MIERENETKKAFLKEFNELLKKHGLEVFLSDNRDGHDPFMDVWPDKENKSSEAFFEVTNQDL